DIDVDSNNDGTIDPDNTEMGTDDPIEEDAPGEFVRYNDNDDNDSLFHDRDEAPFLDDEGLPVPDDLTVAWLSMDESSYEEMAERPDFMGFEMILQASTGVKLWNNRQKE